jgi:hypothetical protein
MISNKSSRIIETTRIKYLELSGDIISPGDT